MFKKPYFKILAICALAIACIAIAVLFFLSQYFVNLAKSDDNDHVSRFDDRLLVVKLSGMLVDSDKEQFLSSMNTVSSAKKALHKAIKNEHIKGILLRIDSPGGTVASSQEIYDLVLAVRKMGKPVVASMSDLAASGGYYVACACDRIVAEPGTITGSIGVIMNLFNLQGIEQKLGIQPEVIKSGLFKDIGSPNRPITTAEKQILDALIQDAYDQFVDAVATGRKMDRAAVLKIADGRIYSGRQAKKLGLIDELGGYDQAVLDLQQLAKEHNQSQKDFKVDEGHGSNMFSALRDLLAANLTHINLLNGIVPESMQSSFYKVPLWMMQ